MYPESPRPHTPDSSTYTVPVPQFQVPSDTASSHPYYSPFAGSSHPYYTPFTGSSPLSLRSSITPHLHLPNERRQWSTGLCNCCDDPGNSFVTCVCPCITFGQIADITNRGSPSCLSSGIVYALFLVLTGLPCMYSCFFRSKLRSQYDLGEAPCQDCLVHCCCESCALCQEYRELQNLGFDMGIGWQANLERQSRGSTTPPGMVGGMMR